MFCDQEFEGGAVVKQQHVCAVFIDMKDSIGIINNQDMWLLTYLQFTRMVFPSKLQLTVALGICKLDYSPVVFSGKRNVLVMGIIIHAYDNFLFWDSHHLGLRKKENL